MVGISSESSSTARAAPPSGVDYSKYNGAKSISSDKFFGGDAEREVEAKAKINQYSGANAISSSDYFGEGEREGGDDAGAFIDRLSLQARQDLAQVKTMAGAVTRKLGDMAGNLMRDLGKY